MPGRHFMPRIRKARRAAAPHAGRAFLANARRFGSEEDGSFVILTLFLFIIVFVTAGIAVDAIRYEAQRTRVQNTLDRAVLAAADMSNTMTPQDVVNQYFAKADLTPYTPTVTTTTSLNAKRVSGSSSAPMDTFFMNWVGIPTLQTNAVSAAEESISNIEVSLVLDISGSMDQDTTTTVTVSKKYGSKTFQQSTGVTKISALKTAAKEFVDTIFGGTTSATVSVSIVPYASQVNVGSTILSRYTIANPDALSKCVDFATADFSTTAISPTTPLYNSGYVDATYRAKPPNYTVCNTSAMSTILPLSGDATTLKSKIDGLSAGGNTSIEIGMKWGSAMLDPSTQPVVSSLISAGVVSSTYAGRPYSYTSSDVMKVIVVMTDGTNTTQYSLNSSYRDQLSGVWKYVSGGTTYYSVTAAEGTNTDRDGDAIKNEPYWRLSQTGKEKWGSTPYGGASATQLTYQQVWDDMSIDYHAYYLRYAIYSSSSDYNTWSSAPFFAIDASTKNTRLYAICDAAKAQGIVVFAIGFEVGDSEAAILEKCASSPSHFYRVQDMEIRTAFQSIANAIGKLRLTQ